MKDKLIKIYRKLYGKWFFRPIAFLIYHVGLTKWFNDIVDFADVHIFHTDYKLSKDYFTTNNSRVKSNLKVLSDQRSRDVYKALIKYRMSHSHKYLKGIVDDAKDMYFAPEVVKWDKQEFLVECGAYNGDTLKIFAELMQERNVAWKALAFECSDNNYSALLKNIKKSPLLSKCVDTVKLASWDTKARLQFDSEMEQSSRMSEKGNLWVEADSIDNVINEKYRDRGVSFVIMDVEGAELPSLRGAVNTISKWHPKLAISIYHTDEDMVDIIEYIHENWPFYKLYIRHYTWLYTETVLYAIESNK